MDKSIIFFYEIWNFILLTVQYIVRTSLRRGHYLASNEDIHTWIERLLKGDEEAFEFIFNLTSQRIYETVFAIVKNQHDTNEIYFQLWKSISTYDQSRPFLFWLNGIVYKQISQWRKHIWKRMRLFEKQQLSDDPVVEVPEKVLLRKEAEELLSFLTCVLFRFYSI